MAAPILKWKPEPTEKRPVGVKRQTVFKFFLGSLDHSPSEQLIDKDAWYTTVLVLSRRQ